MRDDDTEWGCWLFGLRCGIFQCTEDDQPQARSFRFYDATYAASGAGKGKSTVRKPDEFDALTYASPYEDVRMKTAAVLEHGVASSTHRGEGLESYHGHLNARRLPHGDGCCHYGAKQLVPEAAGQPQQKYTFAADAQYIGQWKNGEHSGVGIRVVNQGQLGESSSLAVMSGLFCEGGMVEGTVSWVQDGDTASGQRHFYTGGWAKAKAQAKAAGDGSSPSRPSSPTRPQDAMQEPPVGERYGHGEELVVSNAFWSPHNAAKNLTGAKPDNTYVLESGLCLEGKRHGYWVVEAGTVDKGDHARTPMKRHRRLYIHGELYSHSGHKEDQTWFEIETVPPYLQERQRQLLVAAENPAADGGGPTNSTYTDLDARQRLPFYHGQLNSKGQRHGEGVLLYGKGDLESLQSWAHLDGEKQKFPSMYVGQWMNDRRMGVGVYYHKDRDVQEGEWAKGRMEGQGTLLDYDTWNLQSGWWVAGVLRQGQMLYRTRSPKDEAEGDKSVVANGFEENGKYEGGFDTEGKIHGMGKYSFADGDVHQGCYKNGNPAGLFDELDKEEGKADERWLLVYRKDDTERGFAVAEKDRVPAPDPLETRKQQFASQLGPGAVSSTARELEWQELHPTHPEYHGQLDRDHRRHGRGSSFYDNGDQYIGQWREDKRYGVGALVCLDGDRMSGEWADDLLHGKGEQLRKQAGEKYSGHWVQGVLEDGECRYDSGDATRVTGGFTDQAGVPSPHGECTVFNRDGSLHDGEFKNGLRHGVWKCSSADGTSTTRREYRMGGQIGSEKPWAGDGDDGAAVAARAEEDRVRRQRDEEDRAARDAADAARRKLQAEEDEERRGQAQRDFEHRMTMQEQMMQAQTDAMEQRRKDWADEDVRRRRAHADDVQSAMGLHKQAADVLEGARRSSQIAMQPPTLSAPSPADSDATKLLQSQMNDVQADVELMKQRHAGEQERAQSELADMEQRARENPNDEGLQRQLQQLQQEQIAKQREQQQEIDDMQRRQADGKPHQVADLARSQQEKQSHPADPRAQQQRPDQPSAAEAAEAAAETVAAMDTDGDGKVDAAELAAATGVTVEQAAATIADVDTDGDGKLDAGEIAAANPELGAELLPAQDKAARQRSPSLAEALGVPPVQLQLQEGPSTPSAVDPATRQHMDRMREQAQKDAAAIAAASVELALVERQAQESPEDLVLQQQLQKKHTELVDLHHKQAAAMAQQTAELARVQQAAVAPEPDPHVAPLAGQEPPGTTPQHRADPYHAGPPGAAAPFEAPVEVPPPSEAPPPPPPAPRRLSAFQQAKLNYEAVARGEAAEEPEPEPEPQPQPQYVDLIPHTNPGDYHKLAAAARRGSNPFAAAAVTTLTAPARAGDTVIQVGSSAGLEVGDALVLNPGAATEERLRVKAFGSIVLQSPLRCAHERGEAICKAAKQPMALRPSKPDDHEAAK
jgi:hypothetical protein